MSADIVSLRLLENKLSRVDGTALRFIIPFNSNGFLAVGTDASGNPGSGTSIGFGSANADISLSTDGSIDLTAQPQNGLSFVAPFACVMDGIYLSFSTGDGLSIENGVEISAGAAIYKAESGSSVYRQIDGTEIMSPGMTGEVSSAELFSLSRDNIGANINAGDKLMIVALARADTGTEFTGFFSYSGGVSFITEGVTAAAPESVPVSAISACLQNIDGQSFEVTLATAAVTFPATLYMNADGFSKSADDKTLTVIKAGIYRIEYRVSGTVSAGMAFDVLISGQKSVNLHRTALAATGDVQCGAVLELEAGATVEVQASGAEGTVILVPGVGAELTVIRMA